MSFRKCIGILPLIALGVFSNPNELPAQESWHVTKAISVGGEGGADYITVDPATHRLFVPRTTHTLVIDAGTGETIADIKGQHAAHGVALVPSLHRGFITDSAGKGSVVIFDLTTYKVLGTLEALPDADGIVYDKEMGLLLVSAGDSNSLITFKADIDPVSGKIDPPISLGGAPEFLATDGKGKVFVNLEDKDVVALVDLNTRKVTARWPVAPGGAPVGMALDPDKKLLFIGTRAPQKMVVMNAENGAVVGNMPIGKGVDATLLVGEEAFASCSDGTLTIAKRSADGTIAVAQTLKTAVGAKTMAVDTSTNTIYLPAGEREVPQPGSTTHAGFKPGTFKIIVVNRQ